MADADTAAAEPPKRKNADLPVRLVSAIMMIGLAVGAVMAGDIPFLTGETIYIDGGQGMNH